MTQWAIVDTGPLVALLDEKEQYHKWAMDTFHNIHGPMITCELVVCETFYLLGQFPRAQVKLLEWIARGSLTMPFVLAQEAGPVKALLQRYHDVPMSLADACLVRMAELHEQHCILTLDSDFSIYRKHGRKPLKLLCPREVKT